MTLGRQRTGQAAVRLPVVTTVGMAFRAIPSLAMVCRPMFAVAAPTGGTSRDWLGEPSLPQHEDAFTLVELILVMALLVVLLAVAAPSLGRSMRQRNLDQQSARLLSLTEYARDEAASEGIPMLIWVNPDTKRFGIDAHAGYTANAVRTKEYVLPEDLTFDPIEGAQASKTEGHGLDVAEFAPDGTLDPASVAAIRISGHNRIDVAAISQTPDGYGYQIVKEGVPR